MKFFREKVKMSMLSVRPGWGLVGNSPGADYLFVNKFSPGARYLAQTAMNPDGLKLTNLRWEDKYTWNVGFDIGFFDDRLKFVVELYKQTTKNMLMNNAGIPTSNGWSGLGIVNNGTMVNKGWEFQILGERLLKMGKFSMDVNVNFANNKNTIKDMDPIILKSLNRDWKEENASIVQRVQIDNPFGSIYGFRSKGVYQYDYNTARKIVRGQSPSALKGMTLQDCLNAGITFPIVTNANGQWVADGEGEPIQQRFCYKSETGEGYGFRGGDAIYEDVNNDGNINQLDIVYLGNSLPKLTGGFGFKFHYDRFTLNAQFNYRIDYDIVNMARLNMESMNGNYNQSQAVNYRWRKEGDVTTIPRALNGNLTANYNTLISDRFVEDGTFLRLNYLQLSYSFDPKLLKKWHLRQLNIYASANNLFCLTKYSGVDPEMGYGGYGVTTDNNPTPRSKSYTVGLTIGF